MYNSYFVCIFFYVLLLLLLWQHCEAHKILFHWPGMEPMPPAVEAWSLTTRLPGSWVIFKIVLNAQTKRIHML